jgi:hypothetical protein
MNIYAVNIKNNVWSASGMLNSTYKQVGVHPFLVLNLIQTLKIKTAKPLQEN